MSADPAARHSPTSGTAASRIDGLDLARGLAVLGMVGAHVGDQDAWPWLAVTHGFPSALFAVLAGVSMTLMMTSRGRVRVADVTPDHARRTRIRIAVRGAMLVVMGLALALLGTPVVVILVNLGVMFWLTLPVLRVRTAWLLALASLCLGLGGYLAAQLAEAIPRTASGVRRIRASRSSAPCGVRITRRSRGWGTSSRACASGASR
ncbi:heparan-alpha-glucosaminide N-acetyltransferase domain-containing protein [Demequina litorisediminis]|uniref:Heparan-alpha-glucosaminide N-acetyltransferase catalytic domain-containing protein n=1 Tax=Demequina litorisediminis TaxID=1849022 RepID=A0ABQ6I9Z1_9MICO|nr:heparan-alpha-glucosaminide N-acetyltransferase domain-containing protein [Demequina litorisediminis]GMA34444.1 hypothetical protein GCM10025876_06480 [Demequina litorisediminis]